MQTSILEQWRRRKNILDAAKDRDRYEKNRWDKGTDSTGTGTGSADIDYGTVSLPVTYYDCDAGDSSLVAHADIHHKGHPFNLTEEYDSEDIDNVLPRVPTWNTTLTIAGTEGNTYVTVNNSPEYRVMEGLHVTIDSNEYIVVKDTTLSDSIIVGGAEVAIYPPLVANASIGATVSFDAIEEGTLLHMNHASFNASWQVVNGAWQYITHTYVVGDDTGFPAVAKVPIGTLAVATDDSEYDNEPTIFWNNGEEWVQLGSDDHPVEDQEIGGTTVLVHKATDRWLSHFE